MPRRIYQAEASLSGQALGGGRVSRKKYKLPAKQQLDGAVAGSSRRLVSRFYQLKTGHCLTGLCLNWARGRPTAQCWWRPYSAQTRKHVFKVCREWKVKQKILWAEVRKETREVLVYDLGSRRSLHRGCGMTGPGPG